mmetsp:Transcript_41998/g.50912  ORF Transcript_41998/g.50912 Transcript_41998/m.50912 type:complete len:459 (-) Transcript_41998:126-1502(-)
MSKISRALRLACLGRFDIPTPDLRSARPSCVVVCNQLTGEGDQTWRKRSINGLANLAFVDTNSKGNSIQTGQHSAHLADRTQKVIPSVFSQRSATFSTAAGGGPGKDGEEDISAKLAALQAEMDALRQKASQPVEEDAAGEAEVADPLKGTEQPDDDGEEAGELPEPEADATADDDGEEAGEHPEPEADAAADSLEEDPQPIFDTLAREALYEAPERPTSDEPHSSRYKYVPGKLTSRRRDEHVEVEEELTLEQVEELLYSAPRAQRAGIITGLLRKEDKEERDLTAEMSYKMDLRQFQERVVHVNRTTKVTKGGKVFTFTALVLVGNMEGIIGFGTGKGLDVNMAVTKAHANAAKNLFHVDLFDGHTIWHKTKAKFVRTSVSMSPKPEGSGLVANTLIKDICELAGIKNLQAKVLGSRHPVNTVKAVFKALDAVMTPDELAVHTGRHVVVQQYKLPN